MTDRQPALGKEGRVLITPEDGSPPFYATLEMADDPLDVGTPLCKLTLLSDEACDFLDIPRSSVPSDAFIKLSFGTKMYGYRVTLLTAGGRPASGVTIKGITLPGGEACVTNEHGQAFGVAPKKTTISVESPYLDCQNISEEVASNGDVITEVLLNFLRVDQQNATVDKSRDLKFSPDVEYIDMCSIGAGSSGWGSYDTGGPKGSGSGAGGSIENRLNVLYEGQVLSVAVGGNNGSQEAGSTIISGIGNDVIGEGATAASTVPPLSASTSRNGGNGLMTTYIGAGPGSNGNDRTAYPFDDPSIQCSGGGALGGRWRDSTGMQYPGGTGGESGGGHGGMGGTGHSGGEPGYPGRHYGSGGGGPGSGYSSVYGDGGKGQDGAAMFRWRYKS